MIVIYGKEGCSDCTKTKELLDNMNVNYKYYDLSKKENREQRKEYREHGWEVLPIITCNNELCIEGYNKEVIKEIAIYGE
jgi:glutaredoxin